MADAALTRETLTWHDFGVVSRALAAQVRESGYVPDVVLGIARGGLVPAAALAYALGCKSLFTTNVEFYTGQGTTLADPVMLPPLLDAQDLDDRTVLVVDDVADTGRTLELVVDFCRAHAAQMRVAVVYEKPDSIVKSDYVARRTDLWIDFPWSAGMGAPD